MSCLIATSMFFVTGCSKDDPNSPNNSVPDPEGTIRASMRNWSNGRTALTPDNCSYPFCIGGDDNFSSTGNGLWRFVTIGKVNGLGNITKIPDSGWADYVAVLPGYGYVGAGGYFSGHSIAGVTHVRIYVIDWITSTSGGIIGAEVQYQSPFPFKSDAKEITLSETTIELPVSTNSWADMLLILSV